MMTSFGKRLRFLRIQNQLTQKMLADYLNVSPSTIGMYERDEREPSFKTLISIAEYFNVSIDYLFAYKLDKKYSHPHLTDSDLHLLSLKRNYPELFDYIENASAEELKKLHEIIKIIQ